jgi:hypothetical protein
METDALLANVRDLFALLEERRIEYVLVGGVALLSYVEGRNTEDIDLIMALSSLEKLPEIKVESQDVHFARGKFGGLGVDILLTRIPLFEKVRQEYTQKQKFAEREIPTASVEGLLLLKLYALPSLYRQGNFARVGLYENDIATLMQAYEPDTNALLSVLEAYLGENDIAELKTVLAEIQQRIARFRDGTNK